jgi:phage/plasmid-like protein (TIGR03299 family)
MSHGITEIDRGVVFGTTWHGLPQYVTKTSPVTYEEAHEVLNYPLALRPLLCLHLNGEREPVRAKCVVRSDNNQVLVPHVGERFSIVGNEKMLEHLNDTVLREYPQLQIESVGTLWGGATAFVCLKVDTFTVKGDTSPILNRIMWWNPLGQGGYKTCAHNIRVVCNNTLSAASREGVENGTRRSIAHTATGAQRVSAELEKLARHFLELESLKAKLQQLTTASMTPEDAHNFTKRYLPLPGNLEAEVNTEEFNALAPIKMRKQILDQYQGPQHLLDGVQNSRYAMLQAVTYVVDHERITPTKDRGMLTWDSIIGRRSADKARALEILSTVDVL